MPSYVSRQLFAPLLEVQTIVLKPVPSKIPDAFANRKTLDLNSQAVRTHLDGLKQHHRNNPRVASLVRFWEQLDRHHVASAPGGTDAFSRSIALRFRSAFGEEEKINLRAYYMLQFTVIFLQVLEAGSRPSWMDNDEVTTVLIAWLEFLYAKMQNEKALEMKAVCPSTELVPFSLNPGPESHQLELVDNRRGLSNSLVLGSTSLSQAHTQEVARLHSTIEHLQMELRAQQASNQQLVKANADYSETVTDLKEALRTLATQRDEYKDRCIKAEKQCREAQALCDELLADGAAEEPQESPSAAASPIRSPLVAGSQFNRGGARTAQSTSPFNGSTRKR